MIKAILLVFEPVMTWDRIAQDRKSLGRVLLLFLVPLVVFSAACEVAGLYYWGRYGQLGELVKLSVEKAFLYGAVEILLSIAVVFVGAKAVKSIRETFFTGPGYQQYFQMVAYTLSPLFLLRALDAFPGMNSWVPFGIGIVLSITTLYHGVPRILQPDPAVAFGLYLTSAFVLAGAAAIAQVLALLLRDGSLTG